MAKLSMTIPEMTEFLAEVFPQIDREFEILQIDEDEVIVRMKIEHRHLRPGNTVSGPSMFSLIDVAYYIAVLTRTGAEALAVTTNCNINFMRKPNPTDLIGKARILKHGKVLSVGEVFVYSEGMDEPVAHAQVTYSIPPKRSEFARS